MQGLTFGTWALGCQLLPCGVILGDSFLPLSEVGMVTDLLWAVGKVGVEAMLVEKALSQGGCFCVVIVVLGLALSPPPFPGAYEWLLHPF